MAPTADQIRQQFIDFFAQRQGHDFTPSSPVVPHDDPTLLFTNAGMNQFKPIFLSQVEPGSAFATLKRAVNSQKCIRAGGKHNDLEDVGRDLYHHTFFEMLGNWSFGDFFKEEAVQWAWELFTEVWGLEPERLYATYFGGDQTQGLEPDTEAKAMWERFLPAARVLPGSYKDNFWEMGDTGPCGPCSEIHYDGRDDEQRDRAPGAELVNQDHGDVIELWNLVFIQFNRAHPGTEGLEPLRAKHVDTGMGLERIVRVLQGKRSNYDTDLFTPLFEAIQRATGCKTAYNGAADDLTNPQDVAYRVIADHLRTLVFAIADGADPSNEGRGYVLRRILRRAVRYGRQTLGAPDGFLASLVPVVVERMGGAFPALQEDAQRVVAVVAEEEEAFGRTLGRGIALFEEAAKAGAISGRAAFGLHDTYGFPIDLTQRMAEERSVPVDTAGYERCMEEARERSRAGGKDAALTHPAATLPGAAIAAMGERGVGTTDDAAKFGDVALATAGKIVAVWDGQTLVETARGGETVGVVLDRTCFYAEMGGQVGDSGKLTTAHGAVFRVDRTAAFGGYVLHVGVALGGGVEIGTPVGACVEAARRGKIVANHTATHLLNHALRETLGDRVEQKGSLVDDGRLRFDFTHNAPVRTGQVAEIENAVRGCVHEDLEVFAQAAPLEKARGVRGLRAVFGERYPDPVRVVSVGAAVGGLLAAPGNEQWRSHSVEFCGGAHARRTGEIGGFAVVSEEGVAKGVRRIVAITGDAANAAVQRGARLRQRAENALQLPPERLGEEVALLQERLAEEVVPLVDKDAVRAAVARLQERLKAQQRLAAAAGRDAAVDEARRLVAGVAEAEPVVEVLVHAGADRQALLAAIDVVRAKAPASPAMLLGADVQEGKVAIVAVAPEAAVGAGLKAGDWVRVAALACGGKGGGRPDSAQGGGTEPNKVQAAAAAARAYAQLRLEAAEG